MSSNFRFIIFLISTGIPCLQGVEHLTVTNCLPNFEDRFFLPDETITLAPSCTSKEEYELGLNYDWTYKIDDRSINLKYWLKPVRNKTMKLEIPPYGLPPNNYVITVRSKRKSHVKTGPETILKTPILQCCLPISPFPPVAIIKGGLERTVPPELVVVSGEGSYDPNTRSSDGLKFRWTCEEKVKPETFCRGIVVSTTSSVVIPAVHATLRDVFIMSLHVESKFFKSRQVSQKISVTEKAFSFEISCRKNCYPLRSFPTIKRSVGFTIICHKHCDQIAANEYRWSIKNKNGVLEFDFSKWRYNGTGHKFDIPANTLKWDLYYVTVTVKSNSGWEGYNVIELPLNISSPDVKNCQVHPNEGIAYKTLFKFHCDAASNSVYYEFVVKITYDMSKDTVAISGFAPEVMNNLFRLPTTAGRRFFVRVKEQEMPSAEIEVFPKISFDTENPSIKILSSIMQNFRNNPLQAQQQLNRLLADDLDGTFLLLESVYDDFVLSRRNYDKKLSDFFQSLKVTAVMNMINDPIGEITSNLEVIESLMESTQKNISALSNPLLIRYAMSLCKRMSQNSLEHLSEEVHPFEHQEKALQVAGYLTKCIETYINPNYTISMETETNTDVITTEPSLEDIEDYVDHDEKYYNHLDKLIETTNDLINIARAATKLVAFTTPVGESLVKIHGETSYVGVFKDIGSELYKTTVYFEDIAIKTSADLRNDTHPYDLLLTLWEKDITWWNPSYTKVATSIVLIEYWHSSCRDRILTFTERADLFIPIKPDRRVKRKKIPHIINVPAGFASMTNEELNYEIQTHKIKLPAKRMLHVYFHNVSPGTVFDAVLVVNKFPTIEDFRHGNVTVSQHKMNFLTQINDLGYGEIAYLGILVKKQSVVGQKTLRYNMSSIFTSCVKFYFVNTSWTPTCRPGLKGNFTVVHCRCRRFSVFAGFVENVPSPIQKLIKPNLELVLLRNRTIFVTTVITFAIYLFLMMFVLAQKQDEFFFLADNDANHRFAYLLSVKTGAGCHAGTTANVVVKIKGEKAASEPHVLNYPDPKLRLLQQFGHTMFVLATEQHLGPLKTIELWFDSIGDGPSWDCREVVVYDLQQKRRYYFPVKDTLSLLLGKSYLVLKPSIKTILTPSKVHVKHSQTSVHTFKGKLLSTCKFSLRPRYHTWYLWQKEENYTFLSKLTVILSNVLSCYAVTLMMLGTPKFNLIDNFDVHHDWEFELSEVLIAFFSSFITFMPHISLAWCFRFSRTQLSFYKQSHKLPFRYTIFFWSIIIFVIVASTTYLVVTGFWISLNKSIEWLIACFIGIIFGVFVFEGVFLCIQNLLCRFKIILDISYKFNYIWNVIEIQRTYLYRKFGGQLLRPYFTHLYTPLGPKAIQRRLKVLRDRVDVESEIEELILFGIYIIFLYLVIHLNRDTLLVYTKAKMSEMLQGEFTRTPDFKHIEFVQDITNYLNDTLFAVIHPKQWYGNYQINEPGMMVDVCNKIIGVVRLRQHRMPRGACKVPSLMDFLNTTCSPDFAYSTAEMRTFGPHWSEFSSDIYAHRMWLAWQYSFQRKTKAWIHLGKFAVYPGGGYIAFLGRSLRNSQTNLRNLALNHWLDWNTRAVFIEFLSYNANYNVINSVKLLFEHSVSGYIAKNLQVYSARMVYGKNEGEMVAYTVFTIFIVYTVILFIHYLVPFVLNIRRYYKNFWMTFDIGILMFTLVFVLLFVIRARMVKEYAAIMDAAKPTEFIPYFNLFLIEEFVTYAGAFLLALSTVRLWKFLRFATFFLIFEKTLIHGCNAMWCAIISFMIIFTACACAILLIVGDEYPDYHTVPRLLRLMITMNLEPKEVPFEQYLTFKGTALYWVIAMMVSNVSVIVVAMVVVRSYTEAHMELSSKEKVTYTINSYFRERCSYLSLFFNYRCRIKGGASGSTEKVTPKADKLLYQRSLFITTHHMYIMINMLQCVIRNANRAYHKFSDIDIRLMASIGRNYFRKKRNEVDVFFKGRVHGQKLRLVDEKKIDHIANLTNLLLQEQQPFALVEEEDNVELKECLKIIHKKHKSLHTCNLNLKLALYKLRSVEKEFSEFESRERRLEFF